MLPQESPKSSVVNAEPERESQYLAFQIFTYGPNPKIPTMSEGKHPQVARFPDKATLRDTIEDIKQRIGTVGTRQTRLGVVLGLEWLVKNQRADGLWSLTGPYSEGAMAENTAAATAMPNLESRSPVQMYGCTWGSMSGFTRRSTRPAVCRAAARSAT